MPVYRIRIERCTPYEILIEAPSLDEAEETAAYIPHSDWNEGCTYTQELEPFELEDDDYEESDIFRPEVDETAE